MIKKSSVLLCERVACMTLRSYYFPALFLVPDFADNEIEAVPFRFIRRLWDTSIFDLATLATHHKLHLPYQTMDVFLSRCNMEICICDQPSREAAEALFECLRLALYVEGITPFLAP